MEKRLATPKEISLYTGIPVQTIYGLAKRGDLPCFKLGRLVRFDWSDINSWIESGKRIQR